MRRKNVLQRRFEAIDSATALTSDKAVIETHKLQAEILVDMLKTILRSLSKYDAQIATVAPQLEDYELFAALPGAGQHLTPRLIAAFGEQRERF